MCKLCVYLADSERVPVQLLSEQQSLCEHSFVVVGVFDDGRGSGVAKHRAHVTFKCLNHSPHQLLVPVNAIKHTSVKHVIRYKHTVRQSNPTVHSCFTVQMDIMEEVVCAAHCYVWNGQNNRNI